MKDQRRIRPLLLCLLWIWAVLIFVVVDLFKNVSEFDGIRPRSKTYRAMRFAAHEMIEEPYFDGDFAASIPAPAVARLTTLRQQLRELDETGSTDQLVLFARGSADPRVRIRAIRSLAQDPAFQSVLVSIARDADESPKVRAQAARYLGRTGPSALVFLDELACSSSGRVTRGALEGYAELGTCEAVERLLEHGADDALARARSPNGIPALAEACSTNAAACVALGNTKSAAAVDPLIDTLADRSRPVRVRAAAAESLGRLGERRAMEAIEEACGDPHADVVEAAQLARQRLGRRGS